MYVYMYIYWGSIGIMARLKRLPRQGWSILNGLNNSIPGDVGVTGFRV